MRRLAEKAECTAANPKEDGGQGVSCAFHYSGDSLSHKIRLVQKPLIDIVRETTSKAKGQPVSVMGLP